VELNGDDVLAKLLDLPISTWRYEWEPEGVTHLGPMAQDFAAAFGLGDDDRVIAMVDAFGVLAVAVQAIARRLDALEESWHTQSSKSIGVRSPS